MKEDKRKEICNIAVKLFAEKGFENTSTRDISKAAGMSDAGIYYYFESKEALLFEILEEILATGLESVRKIDESPKSYKEKLTDFANFYTHYYSPEIDKLKLLVEEQKKVNPNHRKELDRIQKEYLDILVRILDGLKASNEMVDLNSTICAFAFFAMVHWVYRWYQPDGQISPKELSGIFTYIISYGIHKREK